MSQQTSTHAWQQYPSTCFLRTNESCSDTRSLTLQLPRNARLSDLIMDLSDGCVLNSTVKALDDAVEDFETMSGKGQAAALLTAWDMTNYNLKVSIPPNGTTNVLLKYQELLVQKLGKVEFQVPLFPGKSVRKLQMDISVEDQNSGILEFSLAMEEEDVQIVTGQNTSTAQYIQSEVPSDSSLPTLLTAYYRQGLIPDSGLMLADGECFTHLFNPSVFLSEAGSMARKIVFVIDVSGSMDGQKLADAKASFASMIDTLDERDTLIVQSFSDEGTEKLWGPKPADDGNKAGAKEFVMALQTIGGTNLNDAFTDGIANVYNVPTEVAPVLVILTDGQGNVGPEVTASSVMKANEGQKVKIFSLAFGYDADMDLLLAIAIQNGGRAVRIYEGFGDAVTQMDLFYRQELGNIMLSDVDVSYDFGDVSISESTVSNFPVLASGSEIVVRGKVDSSLLASSRALQSTIIANSAVGPKEWSSEYPIIQDGGTMMSDCRSSFAQARIVELLEYRDAERAVGDNLFGAGYVRSSTSLTFEEHAREIALDARLVWPGLTALVTLENASCQQNTDEVCSTTEGDGGDRDHDESIAEDEMAVNIADTFGSAGPSSESAGSFVLASCLLSVSLSALSTLFSVF